jgi:hypothetical protein
LKSEHNDITPVFAPDISQLMYQLRLKSKVFILILYLNF